jgi:hypothetical protein
VQQVQDAVQGMKNSADIVPVILLISQELRRLGLVYDFCSVSLVAGLMVGTGQRHGAPVDPRPAVAAPSPARTATPLAVAIRPAPPSPRPAVAPRTAEPEPPGPRYDEWNGPTAFLLPSLDEERLRQVAAGRKEFQAADAAEWARQPGFARALESWYAIGRSHSRRELSQMTGCRRVLEGLDGAAPGHLDQAMQSMHLLGVRQGGNLMVHHLKELAFRGDRAAHLAFTRVVLAYMRDAERGFGRGVMVVTIMVRVALELMVMRHLRTYAAAGLGSTENAQAYVDLLRTYAADVAGTLAVFETSVTANISIRALQRAVRDGRIGRQQMEDWVGPETAKLYMDPRFTMPIELRVIASMLAADADRDPATARAARSLEASLAEPPEPPSANQAQHPSYAAAIDRLTQGRWNRLGTEIVLRLQVHRLAFGRYPTRLDELERSGPPIPLQPGIGTPYEYHLFPEDRVEMPCPENPPFVFQCYPLWPAAAP